MVEFRGVDVLRRVTGGANGRGEQRRSFKKEVAYTPRARTMSRLLVV